MAASKQKHRSRRRRLFAVFLVTIPLLAGGLYFFLRPAGRIDFMLHRKRYEQIVSRAKSIEITPGATLPLYLEDPARPETLRERTADESATWGNGPGDVWIRRTEGGQLQVVVETTDWGNAGQYGFLYSEVPISANDPAASWPGTMPRIQCKVADAWWAVYGLKR